MKNYILIFVLQFAAATAMAANDNHRKAAEELIEVSGIKQTLGQVIDQMVASEISKRPQLKPYSRIMHDFFTKYLGYESIKYDFIDIYVEEFSEKELGELTAFYKSPIGQKALSKIPALKRKGAQVGVSKMKLHAHELREQLETEAKKRAAAQKQSKQKPSDKKVGAESKPQ